MSLVKNKRNKNEKKEVFESPSPPKNVMNDVKK